MPLLKGIFQWIVCVYKLSNEMLLFLIDLSFADVNENLFTSLCFEVAESKLVFLIFVCECGQMEKKPTQIMRNKRRNFEKMD